MIIDMKHYLYCSQLEYINIFFSVSIFIVAICSKFSNFKINLHSKFFHQVFSVIQEHDSKRYKTFSSVLKIIRNLRIYTFELFLIESSFHVPIIEIYVFSQSCIKYLERYFLIKCCIVEFIEF